MRKAPPVIDRTRAIVRFLNAHDVGGGRPTFVRERRGRLVVRGLCVMRSGALVTKLAIIEPTMQAARDWLGY